MRQLGSCFGDVAFEGAIHATFAAFGLDAVYTPVGGDPISVRVIARRPDTIVGFGETRIQAETAMLELRTRGREPTPRRSAHRRGR